MCGGSVQIPTLKQVRSKLKLRIKMCFDRVADLKRNKGDRRAPSRRKEAFLGSPKKATPESACSDFKNVIRILKFLLFW